MPIPDATPPAPNPKKRIALLALVCVSPLLLFAIVLCGAFTVGMKHGSEEAQTQRGINRSAARVILHYRDAGSLPSSLDSLDAPDDSERIDAWGHRLRYTIRDPSQENGFEIVSDGPDGLPGTDDDLRAAL